MSHFIYPSALHSARRRSATSSRAASGSSPSARCSALNGDEGGSWAPASFIVVGGAGSRSRGQASDRRFRFDSPYKNTGEIRLNNGSVLRADGTSGVISS